MEKPMVGGQAVIEGVMMRGFGKVATAVREPDGNIRSCFHKENKLRLAYETRLFKPKKLSD